MVLSNDVIDAKKYETFKKALIGNIIGNAGIIGKGFDDIEKQFDAYWLTIAKPQFVTENNIAKEFIDNIEKDKLKKYLVYTPYDKKERVLKYTTESAASSSNVESQKNMIKGLGASTNQNTNKTTWNDLNGNLNGAYISKAKLNYFLARSFYESGLKYKNPPVSKNVIVFENQINWKMPLGSILYSSRRMDSPSGVFFATPNFS